MVSTAVSKMGMTELVFVIPGIEVNSQYYRDVLLSQQMLPAIKCVASDTFGFQQDNAPSHRARIPSNSYSNKQVRWYIKPSFDGVFTQQYLYQQLLESDNYC